MKKSLFLLGSFMASSLVGANTLLVIGCQKKASVKETKNDEKNTQQVELELVTKLKNEIRNIIDDVITNPADEDIDWMIKLDDGTFKNQEKIIEFLNEKVEEIKKNTEQNQQIQLEQPDTLESNLIDKIKDKFASLRSVVIQRINKMEDLGISNFDFELSSENIIPFLTALNGIQVIEAIAKLKLAKKPTWYDSNTTDNTGDKTDDKTNDKTDDKTNVTSEEIDEIKHIDLFKVKADLNYNFSFGSVKDHDNYNDAELLITGDTKNMLKIKKYTKDNVKDILSNSKEVKDIVIYSDSNEESVFNPVKAEEIQEYGYIGKQMDWDFSKQPIKDEIATMQYDKLNKLKQEKSESEIKDIVKEMSFKRNEFNFAIDRSNYMKFSNSDINLRKFKDDCIFICGSSVVGSSTAVKKIAQQFFSDKDSDPNKWNGGKINHDFMEQVKKDGVSSEGKTPRIKLSNYYGLDEKSDEDADMLIGYGKTTIRKANYAGFPLQTMTIDTNLVSPYSTSGMDDLYDGFMKYVETIISAFRNERTTGEGRDQGLKIIHSDSSYYFLQWNFGNDGEWDIIQNQLANSGDGTVTFDWIMENVLLKKRIENKEYKQNMPENVGVLDTAKTFLKSNKEIKYTQSEKGKYLVTQKDYNDYWPKIYLKYGPFTAYLNDEDWRVFWNESANNVNISSGWENIV